MTPDHAIRSSIAITKLSLGRDILKKKKKEKKKKTKKKHNKRRRNAIFEKKISLDFLTFWLSYSIYSIISGSGTQQVSFMEKFCVKAGTSCIFILY